jgi:hypothetical protein
MKIVKAPEKAEIISPSVFLAGSIEMGKAENWQERLEKELSSVGGTILNPRRDDWDSSWVQNIENDKFREQVEWELQALEIADVIALYFDPTTLSPVSLLELGLFGQEGKMVVCCPDGFWRKGNVDIVCDRYAIKNVKTIESLIYIVRRKLQSL